MALSRPTVGFTWSPRTPAPSITIDGTTYPYTTQNDAVPRASDSRYITWMTTSNTPITFTANVVVPEGLSVILYHWYFGDGEQGYGPEVTHTYKVVNPQLQVTLEVTDSRSQITTRSQLLNLVYAEGASVGLPI